MHLGRGDAAGLGLACGATSVECVLNEMDMERLVTRLRAEMDESADSIRIYRLREPRNRHVRVFGVKPSYDLRDALVF